MKNQSTAIITSIDRNYEENLELDFLESLFRKAKYDGKVIVLDYGMSREGIKRIKDKFDVEIHKVEKKLSVFSARYFHIPGIIESLDEDITQVMVVDGGDVWFQKDVVQIFELTRNCIGVVAEDRIIGLDEWTDRGMENLSNEMRISLLSELEGKTVINAGVVCGDRVLMGQMYKKIYDGICRCGLEYFGIDQLILNLEWYRLEKERRKLMECVYNYVLVSHAEEEYVVKDDMIYLDSGEIVTVVHNAGGNWRKLKRPFENRYVNEKQYYLENITKIPDC